LRADPYTVGHGVMTAVDRHDDGGGPTPHDIAMLQASLASALRAVERTPDELFSEPDLFRIADKLADELNALVHAAQPTISLPPRGQP
jgi:hypothetical protein